MENKPQNVFDKLDKQGEQIGDLSAKLEIFVTNSLFNFTRVFWIFIKESLLNWIVEFNFVISSPDAYKLSAILSAISSDTFVLKFTSSAL